MRTTFRLFAAACLFTASLGCQPQTEEANTSTEMDIDLGEESPATSDSFSNTTATGELPDSNVTGGAETPDVTETPAVTEVPAEETP